MARGTKEFLSLLVESWTGTAICHWTHFSAWWALSSMDSSLSRVLLSATVTRESSSVPTTEPALLTSLSSQPVSLLAACSPAIHSIKEDAGHHRLIKHLQQFFADVEGPQPSQEVQTALPRLGLRWRCTTNSPKHASQHLLEQPFGDNSKVDSLNNRLGKPLDGTPEKLDKSNTCSRQDLF